MSTIEVHGEVAPGFDAVRNTLAAYVADLGEGGAAYAAYHRGRPVVDLWAGQAGERPWSADTTAPWMSSTKAVVSLVLQVLHDRGTIDVFAPVAKYWPDFAAGGKADVTVAQVLTHSSGVQGSAEVSALVDLDNGDGQDRVQEIAAAYAASAPLWPPGTAAGYHTVSFGYLLGEIVRRADGRTLGTVLAEDIAGPLGIGDDLRIGTPESDHARIAPIQAYLWPDAMPAEVRAYTEWFMAHCRDDSTPAGVSCWARDGVGALDRLPEMFNATSGRTAELGSSNMIATARSVARLFSAAAEPDGVDRVRIGSDDSRTLFTSRHEERLDSTLGIPLARGLGVNLNQPLIPRPPTFGPNPEAYGHSGVGGQVAFADPKARVGVGFVRSHYTVFPVLPMLLHDALYKCLPG